MKLSIVATLYQSAKHINDFYQRMTACAHEVAGEDYEIILINDGSPDDSLDSAIKLSDKDSHVVVVDLSRNFGHHKAMLTGLAHATGEHIFLIDSDLEEDPEWLCDFSQHMTEENCDVVFGVQANRKGSVFERFSGWAYYKIFTILTGLALPKNHVTARLMTRRYLNALLLHGEREISIGELFFITGFDQQPHVIQKHNTSESTYSFSKKMVVMINAITSFSNKPLVGIFYIGLFILILAMVNVIYLTLNWLLFAEAPTGWTSVMASIWFLGGLITLFMGVIAIYISKIFSETKQRPNSIVKQIYTKNNL